MNKTQMEGIMKQQPIWPQIIAILVIFYTIVGLIYPINIETIHTVLGITGVGLLIVTFYRNT